MERVLEPSIAIGKLEPIMMTTLLWQYHPKDGSRQNELKNYAIMTILQNKMILTSILHTNRIHFQMHCEQCTLFDQNC